MGVAVVMLFLFYISALKAGHEVTQELAGKIHWLVFPFVQAFTFTAGMSILMTGVRMFLAEIPRHLWQSLKNLFLILGPHWMYQQSSHLHLLLLLSAFFHLMQLDC